VQKGEKEEALKLARRAVEKGGSEAKEPWLQLVSAILLEQKAYDEVIPVLEQLIVQYPKKTYWLQLSAVYSATDRPDRALAVLELAQRQGMLTQSNELMSLAQLYLYNQIPLKAAEVVEDGLRRGAIPANSRTYQLLADSLLHARERGRALDPLRKSADLSDNGNAYLRLAQVYLEREDWPQARAALDAAIEKGHLTSPGHAYLLLGVANANEKRWNEAERAFVAAQDFEPVQPMAASWLQHLANQRAHEQAAESRIAHDPEPKARRRGRSS